MGLGRGRWAVAQILILIPIFLKILFIPGLGPAGVGRKYPVKTVLKRDRLGFGNKGCQPARVTHFGPHDHSSVKRRKSITEKEKNRGTMRKTCRRERVAKEKKEKNWERNMRIYMNTE